MPQIEQHRPPPNPAKATDSRFKEYREEYGTDSSWELDALDPTVIHKLIEDAVRQVRDEVLWDQMLAREVAEKRMLDGIIDGLP